ncbi:MAG: ferric reductase-like transmembrane domain-containing protein [Paracoccaceae bacterium]
MAFAVIALPFVILLTDSNRPPPTSILWDFAMGSGFAALALAATQFALTGRIKLLTSPFGADIIYEFHRFFSWGVVALMLLHFGVLYFWYEPALGDLNPLTARWELTLGRVALVCFGLLIVTSELRKWLRIEYHWWRITHVLLAVTGFAAAIAHVLGVGYYAGAENTRAMWLGVAVVWAGFIIWSRLLRPLVLARNPWRVIRNEAERGGVHTLTLEPEGRPLRAWKAGQFAWLAVGNSPWAMKEHPFTISTAPDRGPEISFSIKPLGDDSARLAKTKPGTLAYVDGPFGTFSVDREESAEGFVMIAGGVGITPIMANLHALQSRADPRPVILIYANRTLDVASFREELDQIATDINLTIVHVPEEAPENWQGESGRIDGALLARHLSDETRDWPHMLCGPGPLIQAASTALRDLGVPGRRISFEIFEMV